MAAHAANMVDRFDCADQNLLALFALSSDRLTW